MEDSILLSTKKILNVGVDYTAFDLDIITHINATLSAVNQLGVLSDPGVFIEDESTTWTSLGIPDNQTNILKSLVYLKVRILFDPPSSSFVLDALNQQIAELEWRLSMFRETLVPIPTGGGGDDYGYDDGFDAGYSDGWASATQDSIGPGE